MAGNARNGRALATAALLAAMVAGCGGPRQISPANRRLVASLATAVSAQNREWLDENVALIEKGRQDGTLSQADYDSFAPIIAKAQAGEWTEAESLAFALRDAQRASSEDVARASEATANGSGP